MMHPASFAECLFLLLVTHALVDFPLQGDFLARAKNHKAPLPGVPWQIALGAHALIAAGAVYLVTGSPFLAGTEFIMHADIDHAKNGGAFGLGSRAFTIDQAAHVACKVLWAASWWLGQ